MTGIRVSNISENMKTPDFQAAATKIGPCQKIYLAVDRKTGLCKGHAYVTYKNHRDAARAIQSFNGFRYDHLVLEAEWSEPENQSRKIKGNSKKTRKLATSNGTVDAKPERYVPPHMRVSEINSFFLSFSQYY